MHGFGLALRLRLMSQEVLQVEMGSLYPARCRLEAPGWIRGSGASRRPTAKPDPIR